MERLIIEKLGDQYYLHHEGMVGGIAHASSVQPLMDILTIYWKETIHLEVK